MKKQTNRLLSILLTLVMLLGMMPTTALAVDDAHSDHSRYITHVEAVEGNCTTPGNIEFWYCSYYTCEKCYSDEAMTQEISPADVVITPGVHSDACVGCEYGKSEKTFELFVPSEHPYYDEDEYTNNGLHILTPQLKGFTFLFVSEYNGALYAMGNKTLADGSRPAINLSEFVGEDGSITVDSDTVEFFTYKEIPYTYTFSPDNGYMTILDEKIVVHGENLCDIDTSYDLFPQSIRFEQNTELSDYAADKGYLFGWALNSPLILFDDSGAEPKFAPALMWSEDENGDYIRDENGAVIDNRAHNIMLYMERCEHPDMKHTKAAEVSCTQDGAIEHWYCEDCHLYFADAQGNAYIELPEGESDYKNYLHTSAWGHAYDDDCICENCGNPCLHTNAFYTELEELEPSCFEPGMRGYWFCEDCWRYLDKDQDNAYWEKDLASRIPATGHYFNTDTGVCDECGLTNPVYKKVTSLNDVNEEDLYIIVAEVKGEESTEYFVLGGLEENKPDEQGNVWCPTSGKNAIKVAADGSISLVNQDILEDGRPSEFMLDVNPEQFGDMTNLGLTTVMLKLPNYCVYPFQSRSFDYNEYMGVPRYGNGVYGMWDSSDWVIDFYTTEVTDDTYRYEDEFGSKTHAEQVADGNIGENITEGNLLLYKSSFYAVGGAMFTLRLREYNDQYYFICGEDGFLEGVTQEVEYGPIKTNDTQYAVWLYRYDVPTVDTHTCDWGDWVDDKNNRTHTRTCQDETCGKTETESHGWDDGVETKAPTCTEPGTLLYTCPDCGASKTAPIDALDHDWGDWVYDSVDSHIRHCKRDGCDAEDYGGHEWGKWTPVDDNTHKMTCSVCGGYQTGDHDWDNGVVTKEPTESEAGIKTYTCGTCSHTKTEPVDKLEHECVWTDWYPNGDENHKRDCLDDNCDKFETLPHDWDNGEITKEPTCRETGIKTFTCQVCYHTRTEDIPTVDHEFGDWTPNNDGATHSRFCSCNESETADHKFDNGEVTQAPTHEAVGEKKYTCADCGYSYTEDIPALTEHEWGEWVVNKLDEANTHIRFCICNESETAPHNFDDGKVTTEATHTSKGVKTFTCSDCGYSYTEEIPETPGHEWSDWVGSNDGRTHIHECKCGETETMAHNWSAWIEQAAGGYKRICADCGAYETMTLDDEKPVNTTTNDNAANTNLTNTDIELIDKVLTDEEQSQIAEGAEVRIYLKVEDISNEAPTEHREKVEAKAGDDEIGMYLDIDLFKQVGNATETLVTETAGAVSVTITIPDNLINTDASVIRIYKIIRVHEGEDGSVVTDVIEGVFNPEDNSFTFETDKFSTYALAYNDQPIAVYTVTYTDGVDGVEIFATQTFTVDAGAATPAFVGTPTRRGYIFTGWTPSVEATVTDNVIYTAVWDAFEPIPMFYTITAANPSNGEIFLSPPVAHKGITVMITVVPNDGYILETLVVTDRNGNEIELIDKGNGKYTFEMPESKVHVNAFFVEENVVRNPFEDVCSDAYYYDAVLWAVKHSITEGTSENTFSPDDPCTRAQMVTFLWRAAGSPEPKTTECQFTDVDMDSYYGKAVLWAVEQGITNGTSDTTFSPDVTCTRAQMVTLLCRMVDGKAVSSTNAFDDVKADAYYAESVQWAIENGITDGTGDNKFSPDATCTRAQLVTFLYRYFSK